MYDWEIITEKWFYLIQNKCSLVMVRVIERHKNGQNRSDEKDTIWKLVSIHIDLKSSQQLSL